MLFIIINAVNIASTDYSYRLNEQISRTNEYQTYIERSITILFIIEFLLKVVSMGFVVDKKSYLRNT